MKRALILLPLVLAFTGCGNKGSNDQMVWCVGPGEVVDAKFKQEYPDLYMSKAACDAVNR